MWPTQERPPSRLHLDVIVDDLDAAEAGSDRSRCDPNIRTTPVRPSGCFPDPGEFIFQLLVGTPQLQAEHRGPPALSLVAHAGAVPFIPTPHA